MNVDLFYHFCSNVIVCYKVINHEYQCKKNKFNPNFIIIDIYTRVSYSEMCIVQISLNNPNLPYLSPLIWNGNHIECLNTP